MAGNYRPRIRSEVTSNQQPIGRSWGPQSYKHKEINSVNNLGMLEVDLFPVGPW